MPTPVEVGMGHIMMLHMVGANQRHLLFKCCSCQRVKPEGETKNLDRGLSALWTQFCSYGGVGEQILSFRSQPILERIYCLKKQNGSHKSYSPLQKWH